MTPPSTPLRRTPLAEWHRAHGARMASCAGWEMPLEYAGTRLVEEHLAVRTRAGLFDLTPVGQVEVAGRDARAALQRMTTGDVARLEVGEGHALALATPAGTIVDTLQVLRLSAAHFLCLVTPGNVGKVARWMAGEAAAWSDAAVLDTSARYALLALHGPASREILQNLTGADLEMLEASTFTHGEVAGVRATIARTSWTGEDGYEVFAPPQQAPRLWDAILAEGREAGLVPAGLGAADTLRLEAGKPSYGREIDETTTVLEAGLETMIAWDKGDFIGREALAAQKARGLARRLVGFEMADRAIARRGHDVIVDGCKAGTVTSGTRTPFLRKAIGLAYVPIDRAQPESRFEVDVRGRRAEARVVPLPFYKRPEG